MPIVPYSFFHFAEMSGPMFAECSWALDHLRYRDYLFSRTEPVILDNSSYVSEIPVDADTHIDISRFIPNCMVVATDFLGDGEKTRNASSDFIGKWRKLGVWKPRLMLVTQGDSYSDFVKTYSIFTRQDYVSSIGIPFKLMFDFETNFEEPELVKKGDPDGRFKLMKQMHKDGVLVKQKFHHFLGMNYLTELKKFSTKFLNDYVCSCDTSLVYKVATLIETSTCTYEDSLVDSSVREKVAKRFDLDDRFISGTFRNYKRIMGELFSK
jgi:hypothetical protein